MSVNPVRILLGLALCLPLLAFWPQSQDPATTDWAKEVERACTAQRYGLRLAAAKKLAAGGGDAVPAIRAFVTAKGLDALPSSVVDAIADQDTVDDATVTLLRDWAGERTFYWRGQALRGLARRGPQLPQRRDELLALFTAHDADPAWLSRTHARFGAALLGVDVAAAAAAEADPRARVRLAALLLGIGQVPPLQPLFDALADERTFQGDPWGARLGSEASQALKSWLGEAHPLAHGGQFASRDEGIRTLLEIAHAKTGQDLHVPAANVDPAVPFAGGLEIFSCRDGDLFVQWTDDGHFFAGLDAVPAGHLAEATWQQLAKERTSLHLDGNLGVVICDSLRLRWTAPEVHVKIAPAALPRDAAEWLKHLAQALEEADQNRLAASLRTGLDQFAAR